MSVAVVFESMFSNTRQVAAAIAEAARDDAVRVVVITGAGRGFCAGLDLANQGEASAAGRTERLDPYYWVGRWVQAITGCEKPIIAAINGAAVGVGVTMTLPMDVRLASSAARFGFVFARRGIVPEAASSWFLPRVVGISRAMEWVSTGRVFDAAEALQGGLVRSVHDPADLLPADITGSGVWEPDRRGFCFVPGPVFANVVLVDELNRTPPRTQSAFLEAMDEGAVTIDGTRHWLPDPFVMLATQNPLEQYGTYPLPEGQLDRFAVTLALGPNDPATERRVVREQLDHATVDELGAVTTPDELVHVRAESRRTHVADAVLDHAVRLAEATREHPAVELGASTRAALVLVRCAQARALLGGRDHVLPDDVKALAAPVLGHRLVLRDGAGLRRGQQLVAELVAAVPVPLRG